MLSQLQTAIRNPCLAGLELYRRYQRDIRGRGIDVPAADWDTLLLLDACRYDLFAEHNTLAGDLSRVVSRGSHTAEFLTKNFGGREFSDIVYISATPQVRATGVKTNFHDTVAVYEEGWDDELRTVPPGAMVETTREAHQAYPNKRIIAHFLQPHYPFIGERGRNLAHGTITGGGVLNAERSTASVWDRLEVGEVSADEVWAVYTENLELVLPYVKDLVADLEGKLIITSDHGNSFGRFGVYGHPAEVYFEELVAVPWLELPYDGRRSITEGEILSKGTVEAVDERLRDLGYR